jgi:transposase
LLVEGTKGTDVKDIVITRSFLPYEPNQLLLLPPDLREWLPEGHLAHFISDIVDEGLDLSAIWQAYAQGSRAHPAYHPVMMSKVLIYAYCTGVYSSRRIEQRLAEDVAFRYLAAQQVPDHKTIAEFRRRHLKALKGIFQQVLELCAKAGLVKLGHVALDGSKVAANASKHSAMSYGRMVQEEARLQAEIEALLEQAERTDAAEDERYGNQRGDELPEELRFRQGRLAKIREAKAALEQQARDKAAAKAKADKQDTAGGHEPPRPQGGGGEPEAVKPEDKAQRNFTDPDSRIMLNGDKAWVQAYNAQVAVDSSSQVIVATEVSNQPADGGHLPAMVEQLQQRTGELPKELSADAGYAWEDNLAYLQGRSIDAYMATRRFKHHELPEDTPPPPKTPLRKAMHDKLQEPQGRERYKLRKQTVEPVFGQIKEARGFRRFLLRGLEKVRGEWLLVCTAHNICKLWAAAAAR